MLVLNLVFTAAVVLVIIAAFSNREQSNGLVIICAALSIVFFGMTTYLGGPQELGQGIVPMQVNPLTKRLSLDTPYEIVSTIPDGKTKILVIKALKKNANDVVLWYAIRVDENISVPKDFTLTDGYPVGIQ